jgi:hypothetical protein
MGIGTYELLQQAYVSSLVPGQHYTVSMEVVLSSLFPSTWSGTGRLKVGLAKNRVKYKSEVNSNDLCTANYVSYEDSPLQDIRIIGSFDLDMSAYPPSEGWKRIAASFRAWDNIDSYDWLFIDVEIPDYTPNSSPSVDCFGDFVYIDEVSLKRAEYCSSPCTPSLGALTYWRYVNNVPTYGVPPTGVTVGGTGAQSFYMYVENAMGIDFTVFNRWTGEVLYNQYAFDPNGLKDSGHIDYWFTWTGEDNNGNYLYPSTTVLVYNLRMWNCSPGSLVNYIGNELAYVPSNLNSVQSYDIVNYDLDDCCDDYAYFQNTTFTGVFREDVDDFITAGENVTTGTQGPVVVASNANVLFHAGSAVNLEPGFSVASGGVFNVAISDCIYGDVEKNRRSPRNRPVFQQNGGIASDGVPEGIGAWPNPSLDGRVHVMIPSRGELDSAAPIRLIVNAVNGAFVSETTANFGQVEDLLFLEAGVYVVRAVDASQNTLGVVKVVVL